MQLIDGGFRAWWKKYSALALAAIAALNVGAIAAWLQSPDLQELVKTQAWLVPVIAGVNSALGVIGFVGRFVKQFDSLINAIPDEERS